MSGKLRLLPQTIINRIAAGEVLERPASAVKELVENSLDAGARNLEIKIEVGGKNLIQVSDDGIGMNRDDLLLAVERHATSKLSDDDLFNITSFGFRGEALPSIGSVARLKISSKAEQQDAWKIEVIGGNVVEPEPTSLASRGTKIEVRDLFFATPARLKFLKTDDSEKNNCIDVIKKIAMANHDASFTLEVDGKVKLKYPASSQLERISAILGDDFAPNSAPVAAEREGVKISGFVGIPTYNRRTSEDQFVFVNKRPVKDKVLQGAIKAAYADYLGGGRFPVLALFIEIPAEEVDVNVHPAKSEVRFRDQRNVTGLLITAIRTALGGSGHKASTTVADFALHTLNKPKTSNPSAYYNSYYAPSAPAKQSSLVLNEATTSSYVPAPQTAQAYAAAIQPDENLDYPLGLAKAQLHGTYIISETANSVVITDQHAAHERLVYENYKKQIAQNKIAKQPLLVPEVIKLDEKRHNIILSIAPKFFEYGFFVEAFGTNEIIVSQIPAILNGYNLKQLLADVADDIIEHGADLSLAEAFEHVLETAACHNSIRAGRKLSLEEMNELLRQMEATPHSGQCNHGRPTYVELKLTDIEKLFGRS